MRPGPRSPERRAEQPGAAEALAGAALPVAAEEARAGAAVEKAAEVAAT